MVTSTFVFINADYKGETIRLSRNTYEETWFAALEAIHCQYWNSIVEVHGSRKTPLLSYTEKNNIFNEYLKNSLLAMFKRGFQIVSSNYIKELYNI